MRSFSFLWVSIINSFLFYFHLFIHLQWQRHLVKHCHDMSFHFLKCETEGFGIYTLMHPSSSITVHLLKSIWNGSFLYRKITTWYKHQWHIATGLLSTWSIIFTKNLCEYYTFSWKSSVPSHCKNTSSSLSLISGYDKMETTNTIFKCCRDYLIF